MSPDDSKIGSPQKPPSGPVPKLDTPTHSLQSPTAGEALREYRPLQPTAIYSVLTALAAAFNILLIVVLSFVLMPRVNRSIQETEKNQEEIRESRQILLKIQTTITASQEDLNAHRASIKRLNAALDLAEARAKAVEKAYKDKLDKDKKANNDRQP